MINANKIKLTFNRFSPIFGLCFSPQDYAFRILKVNRKTVPITIINSIVVITIISNKKNDYYYFFLIIETVRPTYIKKKTLG